MDTVMGYEHALMRRRAAVLGDLHTRWRVHRMLDREMRKVVGRSCGTCGRFSVKETGCDDVVAELLNSEGMIYRDCWRPTGTILVVEERPA